MKPYGVMADLHCHQWSAFAGVTGDGTNDRLAAICAEISRCSRKVLDLGGTRVVIAGDVFHTRGKVAPSVFNPVKSTLEYWCAQGVSYEIIPGNHDLETRDSVALSSSVKMLELPGINVWHEPAILANLAFVPWHEGAKATLKAIEELASSVTDAAELDLFIHAGIDGVLKGVPDHGLTADTLAAFGFKRVFAGHYHHHVDMGGGVFSIGSPTHQTWSDVGTKAGWLIVHENKVDWFASHAPNFIDIHGKEEDLDLIVDGHFVRAKLGSITPAEIVNWREELIKAGAKGVVIQAVPTAVATPREGGVVGSIDRLDAAVGSYCVAKGYSEGARNRALNILSRVAA